MPTYIGNISLVTYIHFQSIFISDVVKRNQLSRKMPPGDELILFLSFMIDVGSAIALE